MNAFNESADYRHVTPTLHTPDHQHLTTHAAPQSFRTALLALAAGLVVCLAITTLGVSLWLALVAGTSLPVIAAWWTLCGTLAAHEPALDVMLDERATTLRHTLNVCEATIDGRLDERSATLSDTFSAVRNGKGYTGTTVQWDEREVERC